MATEFGRKHEGRCTVAMEDIDDLTDEQIAAMVARARSRHDPPVVEMRRPRKLED